ncbi:MAG: peptidoglycan-binding protein [Coriobacteriia bacterium]
MPKWEPVIVTGDYDDRQAAANKLGAVCYYEQHMNSYTTTAKPYGLVEVAHNASQKSKDWADDLSKRWTNITGLPTKRRDLKDGTRGNYNIKLTDMPACLGEPGPISHAAFDDWMDAEPNRSLLALAVAESIKAMFPNGGKVALSIGHLGKTSNPRDTGAADADAPGTPGDQTEGALNADVIHKVAAFLVAGSTVPAPQAPQTPAPAPTPASSMVLRLGSVGGAVGTLQQQLQAHGFTDVDVDGDFGPQTDVEVRAFQRLMGLGIDGVVGRQTHPALIGAPAARQQMPQVAYAPKRVVAATRTLQEALNDITSAGLKPDGKFGDNTRREVREFQDRAGIDVDGVCGPQTWRALGYR